MFSVTWPHFNSLTGTRLHLEHVSPFRENVRDTAAATLSPWPLARGRAQPRDGCILSFTTHETLKAGPFLLNLSFLICEMGPCSASPPLTSFIGCQDNQRLGKDEYYSSLSV